MGRFVNVGNHSFREAVAGVYVDKTELIAEVSATLNTERKNSCVTRCRRFGKSMAAAMLCAYYDKSCDSSDLFRGLAIESHPSFPLHLNKYPVIYVTMTDFISQYGHCQNIVERMEQDLIKDLRCAYTSIMPEPDDNLMDYLWKIASATGEKFFMIIDEWDAIWREFNDSDAVTERYVNLLRLLFKSGLSSRVFAGSYITGILPIKKYNTQSALNNFREYTMLQPGRWSNFYGFTVDEVKRLCQTSVIDLYEMKKWYDGYKIGRETLIFNPNSVIEAITRGECANYWSATGAFDNVCQYIQMNFDGLKDDVINMLAGNSCRVNYTRFTNDLNQIKCKDDVLTVLVHLGYLAYDADQRTCYIPNREVAEEIENAVMRTDWTEVANAISASESLMEAVLNADEEAVAKGVERVHQRDSGILSYNDENSLSCVLSLAFYAARNDYVVHRELATGKGFADLIFIPRRNVSRPAIVMELKYNKDSDSAIDQIRRKEYPDILGEYSRNIILVGINYDKRTKSHSCRIEQSWHF